MNRTERKLAAVPDWTPGETAFKYFKARPMLKRVRLAWPVRLESGREFGPVTVAYETYGRLSPAKDNVILIPHASTGDSHCCIPWSRRSRGRLVGAPGRPRPRL